MRWETEVHGVKKVIVEWWTQNNKLSLDNDLSSTCLNFFYNLSFAFCDWPFLEVQLKTNKTEIKTRKMFDFVLREQKS